MLVGITRMDMLMIEVSAVIKMRVDTCSVLTSAAPTHSLKSTVTDGDGVHFASARSDKPEHLKIYVVARCMRVATCSVNRVAEYFSTNFDLCRLPNENGGRFRARQLCSPYA